MKRYICLLLILVPITFIISGCTKPLKDSDIIIKVDRDSLIKTSEEEIIKYFEKSKSSFIAISEYTLNNTKAFGTSPVILNKKTGIDKIKDDTIKKLADTLLQDGMVKNVSSQNGSIKDVRFEFDYEYGSYQQGIRFVSDLKVIESDKTIYNYIKEYKDLGNGWVYYLYYYNDIKDGNAYRKAAWDTFREQEKKSVVYDWDKAIVTLEDWDKVSMKTGKTKSPFVVSVCFNTNLDGLLGPIVVYFDPSRKEIIGYNLRY